MNPRIREILGKTARETYAKHHRIYPRTQGPWPDTNPRILISIVVYTKE